jgi:hypothetical protein
VLVDVLAVRRARSLAVEEHAEGNRPARSAGQHEMHVARVEAQRDAATGLVQRGALRSDRPLAGQRPVVEAQALGERVAVALVKHNAVSAGEALAAPVAQVRLRGAQVLPVGLRLHAAPFDGDGLALDAQQPLDDAL